MRQADVLPRLAFGWLALVLLVTLLADHLPLHDPLAPNLEHMLAAPDARHWFGADSLGRDVLSRCLHGFRITLAVSLGATLLALLAGGVLGLCAGYFRGRVEWAVMLLVDVLLAFPPLVLIIALSAHPGQALLKVVVTVALVFLPAVTRIARAQTLKLSRLEFVTAAQAMGMGNLRILLRELLPNVLPPLLAYGLLLVAVAALIEAALGFLGLGVPAPAPTLGGMMAAEQARLREAPHAVFFPAALLFMTTLALSLMGEAWQRRLEGRRSLA